MNNISELTLRTRLNKSHILQIGQIITMDKILIVHIVLRFSHAESNEIQHVKTISKDAYTCIYTA